MQIVWFIISFVKWNMPERSLGIVYNDYESRIQSLTNKSAQFIIQYTEIQYFWSFQIS